MNGRAQQIQVGLVSGFWARFGQYRFWILLSPAFLQVIFFFILPILFFFRISFYPAAELTRYAPGFTFDNYIRFFTDPFYLKTFLFTFKLSIIVTLGTLILGYPVAYLISISGSLAKAVYLIIILIAMWTEYIVKITSLPFRLVSFRSVSPIWFSPFWGFSRPSTIPSRRPPGI